MRVRLLIVNRLVEYYLAALKMAGLCASAGVGATDLLGHLFLQLPQIAVADAASFEMADRLEQIFRTRTPVAGGSREDAGYFLGRSSAMSGSSFFVMR